MFMCVDVCMCVCVSSNKVSCKAFPFYFNIMELICLKPDKILCADRNGWRISQEINQHMKSLLDFVSPCIMTTCLPVL